MKFRRIKSRGLAHNSYFLADARDAVVIDPRRDVDVYLDLARRNQCSIRYILETHRNEDYVIGSTAVAEATGATILHSGETDFAYGETIADGDELGVGRLKIRALETPGHTYDSLTFALVDTNTGDNPIMAFTGDALFVGDEGRTDLLGDGEKRKLSGILYDSIMDKILPLGDGVVLCPAHGGGSVCGGDISDRDISSLGLERLTNENLDRDRDVFIQAKLAEKHLKAPYFERMEEWNQQGNAPIYQRLPVPPPLGAAELVEAIDDDTIVVDTRMPHAFAAGHIPGAYNIWLDGVSAYLGWIVPVGRRFALVLPEDADIAEVTRTLVRIGYDEACGYLAGGFESWQNEGREVTRHGTITTDELKARLRSNEDVTIVDVRKPSEWDGGTIEGAHTIFVGDLERRLDEVPRGSTLISMCSVGHRGGIAASILEKHGFDRVYNYLGGYTAWKERGPEKGKARA